MQQQTYPINVKEKNNNMDTPSVIATTTTNKNTNTPPTSTVPVLIVPRDVDDTNTSPLRDCLPPAPLAPPNREQLFVEEARRLVASFSTAALLQHRHHQSSGPTQQQQQQYPADFAQAAAELVVRMSTSGQQTTTPTTATHKTQHQPEGRSLLNDPPVDDHGNHRPSPSTPLDNNEAVSNNPPGNTTQQNRSNHPTSDFSLPQSAPIQPSVEHNNNYPQQLDEGTRTPPPPAPRSPTTNRMTEALSGLMAPRSPMVQRIDQCEEEWGLSTSQPSISVPVSPSQMSAVSGSGDRNTNSPTSIQRSAHQTNFRGKWCLNERYVFRSKLGSGGQATVWRAVDLARSTLDQKHYVAIKIVRRNKYHRREAKVTGPLGGDPSVAPPSIVSLTSDSVILQPQQQPQPQPQQQAQHIAQGNIARVTQTMRTARLQQAGDGSVSLSDSTALFGGGGAADRYSDRLEALRAAYSTPTPKHTNSSNEEEEDPEIACTLVAETLVGLMRHENLLGLEEIIDDPSSEYVFLVTRLLDGPPRTLVTGGRAREGALLPSIVAQYAHDIASGLQQLHACGIVHCDVKTDNLLRDGRRLILADFGLSCVGDDVHVIGGGNGTLAFWPPEMLNALCEDPNQKQNRRMRHTPASDCYALGVCLFIFLCGTFPYWTDDYGSPHAWRAVVPGCRGKNRFKISAKSLPHLHPPEVHENPVECRIFGLLCSLIEGLTLSDPAQRLHAAVVARSLLTHEDSRSVIVTKQQQ